MTTSKINCQRKLLALIVPGLTCLVGALSPAAIAKSVNAPLSAGDSALMNKHLVTIPAGRRLNLVCIGKGLPVVLFEDGLGSHILHWQKVQQQVSAMTTACFYDRAGYGFSDPSLRPGTANNIVDDLHSLVHASGLKTPLILVGHSIGGLYATLYTDLYPKEVGGLVLVDPSFADQGDPAETIKDYQNDQAEYDQEQSDLLRCASLAWKGNISQSNPSDCFKPAPNRTPTESGFLVQQFLKPYRYESVASENENFQAYGNGLSEDGREEEAARRSFGSKPVIVLTAGGTPIVASPQGYGMTASRFSNWRQGHDALAARSTIGQSVVVPDAGHFIQVEKPQAVVDAIAEVIADERTGSQPITPAR